MHQAKIQHTMQREHEQRDTVRVGLCVGKNQNTLSIIFLS